MRLSACSRERQVKTLMAMTRDSKLNNRMTREQAIAWLDDNHIPAVTEAQDAETFAAACAAAERDIAEKTAILVEYVVTRYVLKTKPVSPGRKTAPNAERAEKRRQIITDYFGLLHDAIDAHDADSRAPRAVAARARAATAKKHHCSEREVSRAIRGVSLSRP